MLDKILLLPTDFDYDNGEVVDEVNMIEDPVLIIENESMFNKHDKT